MVFRKIYRTFLEPVISFALPALCIFCHLQLPKTRKIVCEKCFDEMELLPDKYRTVLIKEINNPHFEDLFVTYQFAEKFQKLIHLLKYQRALTLAKYFAASLNISLKNQSYDLITCVPLHAMKEKERGYNQSGLLAQHLAPLLKIKFSADLVFRTKNTVSQTTLDREARLSNVQDAFQCKTKLTGKKVLLVDDVITTGSTLNSCALVLKQNGAACVHLAALATPINFLQLNLERGIARLFSV